jgi:hypothetical protein
MLTGGPSSPRSALALLAVLLLHAALYVVLHESVSRRAHLDAKPGTVARLTVRLISSPVPVPPRPPAATDTRRSAAPVKTPARASSRPGAMAGRPSLPSHAEIDAAALKADAAVAAMPAASGPRPAPSIMESEGTRRAIRASARAPSLRDELAQAREEPARVGPQERLAEGVKSAGKGDCLKGDFAGAGMGLLSVPFLALAAAKGDCAK